LPHLSEIVHVAGCGLPETREDLGLGDFELLSELLALGIDGGSYFRFFQEIMSLRSCRPR